MSDLFPDIVKLPPDLILVKDIDKDGNPIWVAGHFEGYLDWDVGIIDGHINGICVASNPFNAVANIGDDNDDEA